MTTADEAPLGWDTSAAADAYRGLAGDSVDAAVPCPGRISPSMILTTHA
ncbi:hypothetical protein [Streptomyces sp. AGS-58]